MEDIADKYKDMTIGDKDEEIVFEEEPVDDVEASADEETFLVVGTVITDRMVKFPVFRNLMAQLRRPVIGHADKFCLLTYENKTVETTKAGIWGRSACRRREEVSVI
ncbi:unnamed protein product, partial [Cuscuta epithymum]